MTTRIGDVGEKVKTEQASFAFADMGKPTELHAYSSGVWQKARANDLPDKGLLHEMTIDGLQKDFPKRDHMKTQVVYADGAGTDQAQHGGNKASSEIIERASYAKAGYKTSHVVDRATTVDHAQKTNVESQYQFAQNALLQHAGESGYLPAKGISMDDLNTALRGAKLTPEDRAGLNFMRDNFSTLHNSGGVFHSSDRIYASDLTQAQDQSYRPNTAIKKMLE